MNMKAQAWVLNGVYKKLEPRFISLPKLNNGELLVKNVGCSICKSDLHTYSGTRPGPLPSILGHEIIGEIIELPEQPIFDFWNQKVEIGDLITWTIMAYCGECKYCKRGIPQKCLSLKKYGHEKLEGHHKLTGGFATHTHLYAGTVVYKLPDNIDKRILSGLNCSWATVSAAIRLAVDVKKKTVLIAGGGMLGLLTLLMCKEYGAKKIIVYEKDQHRRELAGKFGADMLINGSLKKKDDLARNIELLKKESVDLIFEMTGSNEIIDLSLNIADVGATIILAGSVFPAGNVQINPEKVVRNLWQIKGLHNYIPKDLGDAIVFLKKVHKKYPLELLFDDQSFGLNNIEQALTHASLSSVHRVVIEM